MARVVLLVSGLVGVLAGSPAAYELKTHRVLSLEAAEGSLLARDPSVLESLGLPESLASTVALVVLTLLVAYLSLVLGELVPKRIALQRSAGVALSVAGAGVACASAPLTPQAPARTGPEMRRP